MTRSPHPLLARSLLLAAALSGCGGGGGASSGSGGGAGPSAGAGGTTPAESGEPSGAGTGEGAFALHEWALLDVPLSGATELAAGPGHPVPTMSVRKPVVYVHLADGVDETSFAIEARMASGSIVEHWPPAATPPGAVRWEVAARRAHCVTSVVPAGGGRWATPADGVSELPDLPSYDAPGAACLTVGDASAGLLFYRGTMSAPTLPVTAARASDGSVVVTATGETAGAPFDLLRVTWIADRLVISRAAMPAAGASVSLPVGTDAVDPEAESARLARAMVALGLTADEADAFLRAWRVPLFGEGVGAVADRDARRSVREPVPSTFGPLADVLLVWLPPAAVDAIATLDVAPAPSVVARAFLVRIQLS